MGAARRLRGNRIPWEASLLSANPTCISIEGDFMARHVLLPSLILALFLFSLPALADDVPAVAFLKEIIGREFDGDYMARIDKVYYTDGKSPEVGSCGCSMPRESWDLDVDNLSVVSSWHVVGTKNISSTRKIVTMRFHVLATTHKQPYDSTNAYFGGFRLVNLPFRPHDEIVSYKVWKRNGQWKLADPPLPRVAADPIIAAFRNKLPKAPCAIEQPPKSDDSAKILTCETLTNFWQSQIFILEYAKIRPLPTPPPAPPHP